VSWTFDQKSQEKKPTYHPKEKTLPKPTQLTYRLVRYLTVILGHNPLWASRLTTRSGQAVSSMWKARGRVGKIFAIFGFSTKELPGKKASRSQIFTRWTVIRNWSFSKDGSIRIPAQWNWTNKLGRICACKSISPCIRIKCFQAIFYT